MGSGRSDQFNATVRRTNPVHALIKSGAGNSLQPLQVETQTNDLRRLRSGAKPLERTIIEAAPLTQPYPTIIEGEARSEDQVGLGEGHLGRFRIRRGNAQTIPSQLGQTELWIDHMERQVHPHDPGKETPHSAFQEQEVQGNGGDLGGKAGKVGHREPGARRHRCVVQERHQVREDGLAGREERGGGQGPQLGPDPPTKATLFFVDVQGSGSRRISGVGGVAEKLARSCPPRQPWWKGRGSDGKRRGNEKRALRRGLRGNALSIPYTLKPAEAEGL